MKIFKNKIFKYIMMFLGVIMIFVVMKITLFKQNIINNISMHGEKVSYNTTKYNLLEASSDNKVDKIEKIEDINILFNGELLKLDNNIYENKQRYYIEVKESLNIFSQTEVILDDNIIKTNNVILDLNNKEFIKDNNTYSLRGNLLEIEGKQYISLTDLEFMFNLRSKWNYDERQIYVFNEKEILEENMKVENSGKVSLLRLEDISAGGAYASSVNIEKMKIIGDYFYSQESPFHIAWIPRFKDPGKNIDNDLLNDRSMANVQFINMLDYLIYKGGIIGLHGYAHQSGDEPSGVGSELTRTINTSEEEVREVVENGIKTAKSLNIPVDFFETPHYHASRKQQRIIEEYFNIIYEPYTGYWNMKPLVSLSNESTVYMPTNLSYVKDKYAEKIVGKIGNNKSYISSLFIHPWKETGFINFEELDENGYVKYVYEENTPIKNITTALKENQYKASTINIFK